MTKKLLLILAMQVAVLAAMAQQLNIASYNIRLYNTGDFARGEYWDVRGKVICDQMNFMQPDAFGAQEVVHNQLEDILRMMPDYDYVGVGRDDGKTGGEYSPIFYRKDRLKLLNSGTFWLSETPEEVSFGWDAACRRVCSWGEFKVRGTKLRYFHFNLHMDHIGKVARREASKLIVERVRTIAKGAPVVVTGDFNVAQDNEIFKIFTESGLFVDSRDVAEQIFETNGTFNDFGVNRYTTARIDHILVSPEFTVTNYGVLTDSYWTPNDKSNIADTSEAAPEEVKLHSYTRRNPSDHYPIMSRLVFNKKKKK